MTEAHCRKTPLLLKISTMVTVLLLPPFFDPYSANPLEQSKVALFRIMVVGMILISSLDVLRCIALGRPTIVLASRAKFSSVARFLTRPLIVPILLYCGTYGLSTIVSINPQASFWGLGDGHGAITMILVIMFSLMAAAVLQTWRQFDQVVTCLIVSSVPVAIYGWTQYLGLDALNWTSYQASPVHSTFALNVFLGGYLVMVIPFTLSRIMEHGQFVRGRSIQYLLILFLQCSCLLLSLARGSWLAFLGSCWLFFGLLFQRRYARRFWVVSAMSLGIGVLLYLVISLWGWMLFQFPSRSLSETLFTRERETSNLSRLILWQCGFEMLRERLLTGYGPETFSIAYASKYGTDRVLGSFWFVRVSDPHNLFLYNLTALGITGFAIIVWILAWFYSHVLDALVRTGDWQNRVSLAALLSAVTAYLIQAQFNPDSIVNIVLFWLFVSVGSVLAQREKVAK